MIKPGSKVIVRAWEPWCGSNPDIDDWQDTQKATVISVDRNLRINVTWESLGRRISAKGYGFLFAVSDLVEVRET